MEINGIAHIQLTVNDLQRAIPLYESVLGFMGMRPVVKSDQGLYMIGGRTAVAVRRASEDNLHHRFDQQRIGLHHVCFRVRAREDIDTLHDFLLAENVHIVHPPEDGPWAPGYYSVLFQDPDGIRLEANHVPGKGHLAAPQRPPITSLPGYEP